MVIVKAKEEEIPKKCGADEVVQEECVYAGFGSTRKRILVCRG